MHEDTIRREVDGGRASRGSAYARAQHQLRTAAAESGLSSTAQLLVRYLLDIADPHVDGWAVCISNETLAARLNRSEGHIRRLLQEVGRGFSDVVRREPGSHLGDSSQYVILVRPLAERASALCPERASAPCQSAQARPLKETSVKTSEFQQQQQHGGGAAAAAAFIATTGRGVPVVLTPLQEGLKVAIMTPPRWFNGPEWVRENMARRLAAMPCVTTELIEYALRETYSAKQGGRVPNLAGYFISQIRETAESLHQHKQECAS